MIKEGIGGFCMALADSVPGVSGGTVAFIMGFYDQFIGSIHDLVFGKMKEKKLAFGYLAKLGVGWVLGMVLAILALSVLFENHGIYRRFYSTDCKRGKRQFSQRGKKYLEIMSDFVIPSTEFCREQFVARGMIVDLAVHEGKPRMRMNQTIHEGYEVRAMEKDDENAVYRRADCQSKPDRPCVFSERTRGTVDEKWQRISLEKA